MTVDIREIIREHIAAAESVAATIAAPTSADAQLIDEALS